MHLLKHWKILSITETYLMKAILEVKLHLLKFTFLMKIGRVMKRNY